MGGALVREGLTAVISVKHSDPQFEGQTKTKLGNANVRGVVSSIVTNEFNKYLEEHPDAAEAIVMKAVNAYKAKKAAKKAEELTRRKSATVNTRLPGKLSDCQKGTPAEDAEIFIVEGDSAGGSAKQARDPENQAILPLRGKILNVEKNRLNKILEHDQIQNIITALGTGIDDEFDIDDLRYNTIVLFVDADVDGAHIKTLMLTFIFRHMPELLERGHIYAAKSPLYRIRYKGETYDAMTEAQREQIVNDKCNGNPDNVQRFKGLGEMNPEQLWETTMNPKKRRLEQITIQDAAKADRIFSILMGSKVGPRRDFIRENAGKVEWIDI
jgi:DNA gyrase subunit B